MILHEHGRRPGHHCTTALTFGIGADCASDKYIGVKLLNLIQPLLHAGIDCRSVTQFGRLVPVITANFIFYNPMLYFL